MLAERKKRVKWTLNPRGNSWSKDTNKFGQRMLEKMGWKSGEGLGVNKQGITEHIKVAYKNDNKCLGYKDNGEEWVEHQSQFESLLAELSSSHSTIAALDSAKNKISQTETLEQRSRHSRTRVHYQKFTRGKDLSKYSDKDLKCILIGKQKADSADEENEDNDGSNEYFNGFYGIKTINSGSMNDYFKKITYSQNYSDSSDVQFGKVEVSKKNNDVGEQYDVKVKKQKKRKAEEQMSGTEHSSMDSNERLSIKQHKKKKKRKILEHSDSANDDCSYTDHENGTVSKKGLQSHNITDPEGTIINGICNVDTHCDKIYREKTPKKWKNCSIQDRECEVMDVDDKREDKQVKKKTSKKKNFKLINEDSETSFVPAEAASNQSENSEALEHLTDKVDDEIEVRQAKKESRKKHPVLFSEEDTSLVPVECVSHAEDTELHFTAELNEVECKQKNKKCKKKKRDFIGDYRETSVIPVEDVSQRLENSKDAEDHLSVAKQLKKKLKKKKHNLLSESGEISVLPTKDVTHTLENSKGTEQHLTVEVADEIEGKRLKKKLKKRRKLLNEGVPLEDISQMFENSENSVEHSIDKDEEKLEKGTHGVHISPEDSLKFADVNRLGHGASSDNEVSSNEQTADDVMPTKRKKKKNAKMDDVENSVAEDTSKDANKISVEKKKKKHKRKKGENEVDGQSEQAEHLMKDVKRTNADEELQSAANSINGSPQSNVNENIAEKLNKDCSESPAKLNEKYSLDEIKNMKPSLFAQLVDPRLVEFKGSNLHTIAGYGKC